MDPLALPVTAQAGDSRAITVAALITGVMNAHSLVAPMLTPHPAKTLTNDPAPRQDRALTPAPGLILIQGHILVQGLTLAQGLGPLIAQGPTPVMTIAAAPSFEIQLLALFVTTLVIARLPSMPKLTMPL